jgi:HK97 family phage major capsid protein
VALLTTSQGVNALTPDQILDLIVRPVQETALAFRDQVATPITTSSTNVRIPIQTGDGDAAWVAEGEEIDIDDSVFDEMDARPRKVAGIRVISRETAEDTTPEAQELVGRSLVRALAGKIDSAFFGSKGSSSIQPAGLLDLADATTIAAGAGWTSLDPFEDAIAAAAGEDAVTTAFVANPADAVVLAKLKEQTNSQKSLLQPDPTLPTRRTIRGVPLLTSKRVDPGAIWGLPAATIYSIIRQDVRLDVSDEAYFTSDRIGIRATARVDFAFTVPAAVTKVTVTP